MSDNADTTSQLFQPFTDDIEVTHRATAQNLEEFDPFQIGATSLTEKKASPAKSCQRKGGPSGGSVVSKGSKGSSALPPRLDVKFKVHEEISSTADTDGEHEGSSSVFVEGIVMVQVTSSDAIKNAPFILVTDSSAGSIVTFKATEEYAKMYPTTGQTAQMSVIKVPKQVLEFVDAGSYQLMERIAYLPMLLERRITREKAKVQVAIQVRSKLANPDDMKLLSIALSVSDKVDGDSVEINAGEGEWDRTSRTIQWKLERLVKGDSFMVSARGRLTDDYASVTTSDLAFPVMMRCESDDQISSATFTAVEASGYPATISTATVQKSFRIVHRLK